MVFPTTAAVADHSTAILAVEVIDKRTMVGIAWHLIFVTLGSIKQAELNVILICDFTSLLFVKIGNANDMAVVIFVIGEQSQRVPSLGEISIDVVHIEVDV